VRKLFLLGLAALTVAGSAGAASAQPRPLGDRDHDGVPNVIDPRNDNRGPGPRGPMGDRDRDGRPNFADNHDDRWDSRWGREVRPPHYWGARAGWSRHVRACMAAYRSYNPRSDSYVVRRGVVVRCRL
jgi:hypothetical protein